MNNSGVRVTGAKVLVKPEPIEEVTKGGIVIASTIRERSQLKQTRGELVDVGPLAGEDQGEPWVKPGDTVMFARYGGIVLKGKDGEVYRILNDEDITAGIEEGVSFDAEY